MGIDFPNSPTVGQLHPDPAQLGIPQYEWDGSVWKAKVPGTAATEAVNVAFTPAGNIAASNVQAAMQELDTEKVAKSGGVDAVMTGALTLPAVDPTDANHAARKSYVDTKVAYTPSGGIAANTLAGAIAELDSEKVAKLGDTMTGQLNLNVGINQGLKIASSDGATLQGIFYNTNDNQFSFGTVTNHPVMFYSNNLIRMYIGNGGDVHVLSDPVSATSVATKQYVDNTHATLLDAFAFNGMQINGGLEVSQERGSNQTNVTNTHICDGWLLQNTSTAVVNVHAVPAVYVPGHPVLFSATPSTPQASLTGGQFVFIEQRIEGNRTARLSWGTAWAQPITLGFWSAHRRTGIYSGSVRNGAGNRSYTFTYTQNVVDVPEYKIITIPGDTAGTWLTNNGHGLNLSFVLACGPTYTAPTANVWAGANYIAAPGQVNGVATGTDVFRLTGVVVLPGIEAPSATRSPFIMRPFGIELETCKRYYRKTFPYATAVAQNAGTAGVLIAFPTLGGYTGFQDHWNMRAAPTMAFFNHSALNSNARNVFGAQELGIGTVVVSESGFFSASASPGSTDVFYGVHYAADARL